MLWILPSTLYHSNTFLNKKKRLYFTTYYSTYILSFFVDENTFLVFVNVKYRFIKNYFIKMYYMYLSIFRIYDEYHLDLVKRSHIENIYK